MVRRLSFSLTRASVLTLGAGLAASCALFVGVSHLEYDNLALSFSQRADQRVATVRQGLHDAVEVATVTNQLFALGAPVTLRDLDIPEADLDRIADNVMETKGGAPIGMMKKLGREDVLSILRRAF